MVGQEVGPYRIVRLLGTGGMGQVFEAIDKSGRRVALKVLRAEHAGDGQMAARLVNEARAIRLVEHPGVVTIYDAGVLPSGVTYIAMEYLAGTSLREHLRAGLVQQDLALHVAHQVATALAAVHARRIIHRDLKPENILLIDDSQGRGGLRAKVLDFGIAKLAATSQDGGVRTRTGLLMGTPTYMAPEQCGGPGEIGDRIDVYALGIMLYEMLAGKPPFQGEQDAQIIGRQLFVDPQPLSELAPHIDPWLAGLVHRMLAKAPAERPGMVAVAAELARIQGNSQKALCALPSSLLGMAGLPFRPSEQGSARTADTRPYAARRPSVRALLLCTLASLLLGVLLPTALGRLRTRPAPTVATSPGGHADKLTRL